MLRKLVITFVALLLFGIVRTPFEIAFFQELKTAKLIAPELDPDSQQNIGLVSYAAVLGGLRAPVASMLNLEAFSHFEKLDWESLEETYKTITSLQPYNAYYWETAGWHLAYNAYADYRDRVDISEPRRRLRQRHFLNKGAEFYEEGIQFIPENADLHRELAYLWSNHLREPDYAKSAQLYEKALIHHPHNDRLNQQYTYALVRVPGREGEAFQRYQPVGQNSTQLLFPTDRCLYFVLQEKLGLPTFAKKSLLEIFKTPRQAYTELARFYQRAPSYGFPRNGILTAIKKLETELLIPQEKSVLRKR